MDYDLIIIGGGPGGYYACSLALQNNLRVLLIEKNKVGGVCLNSGCIPSKSLLHNAKMYQKNLHQNDYAFDLKNLRYDQTKAIAIKNQQIATLVSSLHKKLIKQGAVIINSEANVLPKQNTLFMVQTKEKIYSSQYLLLATGAKSFIPNSLGGKSLLSNPNVILSKQALDLVKVPQHLCIVGGGVIALEMASYYMQIGSKVTIIIRGQTILKNIDEDLKETLSNYLLNEFDFKIITNANNMKISDNQITFDKNNETQAITFDKILIASGRKPNVTNIGLDNISLDYDKRGIKINEKMETNVVNMYAIGDVVGQIMLAHVAYQQATIAIEQICQKHMVMNYDDIPSVIYTNPEIAFVGISEQKARSQNVDFYVKKVNLLVSGKYFIESPNIPGFVKFIIERNSNQILGISIIGENSGELISSCSLIVNKKMNLEMLKTLVLPHPSVGEILKEVIMFN